MFANHRQDLPPRKTRVGTLHAGGWNLPADTGERAVVLAEAVDELAAVAEATFAGERLDLAVLPEAILTAARPGGASETALDLRAEPFERLAAAARRNRTYLVLPMIRAENRGRGLYRNSAVLLDRAGRVAGIYDKVHAVADPEREDLPERGVTPGAEFPVFACDFGRLGIQICFDMSFDDGWEALARQQADLVAWPSASPQTARPAARADRHGFYIVSSTWRDNASVFEPTGVVAAQAGPPARHLVARLDLSFAVLHWQEQLHNGQALRARYGERIGFRWHEREDCGLFWSNDPAVPVGRMVREAGFREYGRQLGRNVEIERRHRAGAQEGDAGHDEKA